MLVNPHYKMTVATLVRFPFSHTYEVCVHQQCVRSECRSPAVLMADANVTTEIAVSQTNDRLTPTSLWATFSNTLQTSQPRIFLECHCKYFFLFHIVSFQIIVVIGSAHFDVHLFI